MPGRPDRSDTDLKIPNISEEKVLDVLGGNKNE